MRRCDFLLVRHSRPNLGPILHRFGDIAGFLLMAPFLFHLNFGGVPIGATRSRNLTPCLRPIFVTRQLLTSFSF